MYTGILRKYTTERLFVYNELLHLFPTIALQYGLTSEHLFQFSGHGRRITRPNYGDLNPFTYIFDDYTHEGGNTKLHPSFSDNIELGYVYRLVSDSLFLAHTDDAIMKSYREQEERRIYVMPQNLSSYVQTGVRVHAANLSPTSFWKVTDRYRLYNNYELTRAENEKPYVYPDTRLHEPVCFRFSMVGRTFGKL